MFNVNVDVKKNYQRENKINETQREAHLAARILRNSTTKQNCDTQQLKAL